MIMYRLIVDWVPIGLPQQPDGRPIHDQAWSEARSLDVPRPGEPSWSIHWSRSLERRPTQAALDDDRERGVGGDTMTHG
jgi:hypothetical protein